MLLFMDVWLNLQCCRWDLHCFWIQLKQNLKFISVFQPIPIRSNLRHLFALLVTVTILFRLLVYGGFLKCGSPHKSSILVGFSLLNYLYPPILGYPHDYGNPHIVVFQSNSLQFRPPEAMTCLQQTTVLWSVFAMLLSGAWLRGTERIFDDFMICKFYKCLIDRYFKNKNHDWLAAGWQLVNWFVDFMMCKFVNLPWTYLVGSWLAHDRSSWWYSICARTFWVNWNELLATIQPAKNQQSPWCCAIGM